MYQLYNGDCLKIMKNIPDKSIDLILTDPPYGTTACKWDSIIPFEAMWSQYNRIIKPNSAVLLFGSEPFSSSLRMSNIKNYKYDWIWKKSKAQGFLNCKKMPLKDYENICVFCRKQPLYNPQGTKFGIFNNFRKSKINKDDDVYGKEREFPPSTVGNYPKQIIEFSNKSGKDNLHPTQKPVALLEYLIKTYTNEGETVLDSCMGSGSTGVACLNTNRNFIGIELDERYFKIAEERLREVDNND